MDNENYSCEDGKCGNCPRCNQKKSMMAMGYSEAAVDAVLFSEKYEIMAMVKTRLKVMHGLVSDIEEAISSKPNGMMDQWMIDKVTMSADYLSAVADNAKFGDGLESSYGEKKSLWENIHAKRKRIKAGSGERMRKKGDKGAPDTLDVAEKTPKSFESGGYGKGLSEKQQDQAAKSSKKAMKAEKEGKGLKEQYKPWDTDKEHNDKLKKQGKKTPKSKHTEKYERMYGKDSEDNSEDSSDFKAGGAGKSLAKKAEKSGISLSVLRKVYQRGMGAWKSGHRPGMSPQAWAMARVNSFITGGGARKADKDLLGGGKGKKSGDKRGKKGGVGKKS